MYPLLPVISKVLVLERVGWEGNQDSSEIRGPDPHEATERPVSLGRGWVGQDAKPHMTYEQFLNQTERGRKREGRCWGKKRKGESKG